VQQGDELTVQLRLRALGRSQSNMAVIDLLPGGFEVIRASISREKQGWRADYIDIREDRVVWYGSFDERVRELSYRIKATTAGRFTLPAPYAEAMYRRSVRATGLPGEIVVKAAE